MTEEEFNDWYDNEHVPLRMAIPTFCRNIRWIAADGERPQYLATNDVDSCDVFDSPPYNTLVGTRSERERDVINRTQLLDRRTWAVLHHVASVKPELEDDLNRWYREEHIPLLAKVPGRHRLRRYVLREAGPARRR